MPLELGWFLAAKKYGGDKQQEKKCLILDSQQHRYLIFISDLRGSDVGVHEDDECVMVQRVRDFLFTSSRRKTIPTAHNLRNSYQAFTNGRNELVARAGLGDEALLFADFEKLAIEWVREDASLGSQN